MKTYTNPALTWNFANQANGLSHGRTLAIGVACRPTPEAAVENAVEAAPNRYRMLQRVVRHGAVTVNALALLTFAGGVGAALALSAWWLLPIVLLAGAVVYVLGHSFVELVTLIVDMMVPM